MNVHVCICRMVLLPAQASDQSRMMTEATISCPAAHHTHHRQALTTMTQLLLMGHTSSNAQQLQVKRWVKQVAMQLHSSQQEAMMMLCNWQAAADLLTLHGKHGLCGQACRSC